MGHTNVMAKKVSSLSLFGECLGSLDLGSTASVFIFKSCFPILPQHWDGVGCGWLAQENIWETLQRLVIGLHFLSHFTRTGFCRAKAAYEEGDHDSEPWEGTGFHFALFKWVQTLGPCVCSHELNIEVSSFINHFNLSFIQSALLTRTLYNIQGTQG